MIGGLKIDKGKIVEVGFEWPSKNGGV